MADGDIIGSVQFMTLRFGDNRSIEVLHLLCVTLLPALKTHLPLIGFSYETEKSSFSKEPFAITHFVTIQGKDITLQAVKFLKQRELLMILSSTTLSFELRWKT